MRAVVNDNGIRTVDVAEPGGEGVRVSVAAAGICGTDVAWPDVAPSWPTHR